MAGGASFGGLSKGETARPGGGRGAGRPGYIYIYIYTPSTGQQIHSTLKPADLSVHACQGRASTTTSTRDDCVVCQIFCPRSRARARQLKSPKLASVAETIGDPAEQRREVSVPWQRRALSTQGVGTCRRPGQTRRPRSKEKRARPASVGPAGARRGGPVLGHCTWRLASVWWR